MSAQKLKPPTFVPHPRTNSDDLMPVSDAHKASGENRFEDVFTDIHKFQVGCLKPSTEKDRLPIFIPIFPFCYNTMDYGESLRGKVRLNVLKSSSERLRLLKEFE